MKKTEINIGDLILYKYPDGDDTVGLVISEAPYRGTFDVEWYERGSVVDYGRYDKSTLLIWANQDVE